MKETQHRTFSQMYVNLHLAYRTTRTEVCSRGGLAAEGFLSLEEAQSVPCVLIPSPDLEGHEWNYYHTTLGFGSRFLSAPTLDTAWLLVSVNRGILPIEVGESKDGTIHKMPILQNGESLRRRYCAFWRKDIAHPNISLCTKLLESPFQN